MQLVFSLKATEFLVEGIKYQTEDRRRNFESTHLYSLTVTILYPYALWIFKSRKETASFLNQTFKISALMKISALVHSSSLSHPISFKDPHFDQFSPLPSWEKNCTALSWAGMQDQHVANTSSAWSQNPRGSHCPTAIGISSPYIYWCNFSSPELDAHPPQWQPAPMTELFVTVCNSLDWAATHKWRIN